MQFVDVGCGFGGLLVRLSPLFPDTLMLGMELRDKACSISHLFLFAPRKASRGTVQCMNTHRCKMNSAECSCTGALGSDKPWLTV